MAPKTVTAVKVDFKIKTRVLLNLWSLGGSEKDIKQSELTKQVKLNTEKTKDYQNIYTALEKEDAIAITPKGRTIIVTLTTKGLQVLDHSLKDPYFQYKPQQRVRTKDFNALLKWIQQSDKAVTVFTNGNGNGKIENRAISSYEEFKVVALEVYHQLNQDYNLDHLVPIYRIRRAIGDRVSRSQFSEWLLEMQANELMQLIGGEMTDITQDKAEDSIKTDLGAIRYYAKLLNR